MKLDTIAETAGICLQDKVSSKSKFTYGQLFEAIMATDNIAHAALILGVSDNSLEHTLSRNIKPLFPGKLKATRWKNYFYSLIKSKQCTGCKKLLDLNNYSISNSNPDGYNYYCKACRALVRKKFTEANPNYARQDYINNKAEYIARAIKYKTAREQATPPWANLTIISRIYECAEGDHVDHIVPLQGKNVCGLHVENNLQYLSPEDNLEKSNKFTMD